MFFSQETKILYFVKICANFILHEKENKQQIHPPPAFYFYLLNSRLVHFSILLNKITIILSSSSLYSCLENPVDRGAWWAAVHGTAQSQTRLKCMHACTGEGNGSPLQCSCLENPRDGGASWAAVYGVAQSRTRLKRLSSSSSWYRKH